MSVSTCRESSFYSNVLETRLRHAQAETDGAHRTGEGRTLPPSVDGKLSTVPLPRPELPVNVSIAGQRAEILYSGAAPGLVAGVF